MAKAQEMGIQPTATDFIATRLCHRSSTKARQKRPHQQNRATQLRTTLEEFFAMKVIQINVVGAESIIACPVFRNAYPHIGNKANEVVDV